MFFRKRHKNIQKMEYKNMTKFDICVKMKIKLK